MHSPSEATDTPRLSAEDIDAIRASHDIVAFIGRDVPLKKSGTSYKTRCPFHEERSASFSVFSDTQRFKCFGCGVGGDLIAYVMESEGLEFRDALDRLRGHSGSPTSKRPLRKRVPTKKDVEEPALRPWSSEVEAQYNEGWIFAEHNLGSLAKELAEYRGWPVESCVELLAEGVIAKVLDDYGHRLWAFPVAVPTADGQLTIGIHKRSRPPKKEWFFSAGAISVPFILGDPAKAKTWIVTEGQWDALSISIAMSPSSPHQVEREDLAIVGIRGASGGIPRFVQTYGALLKGAECVLVPDADESGMAWMEAEGLFHKLEDLGASVRAYTPCESHDCNDALKAGDLTSEVVAEWLKGAGHDQ